MHQFAKTDLHDLEQNRHKIPTGDWLSERTDWAVLKGRLWILWGMTPEYENETCTCWKCGFYCQGEPECREEKVTLIGEKPVEECQVLKNLHIQYLRLWNIHLKVTHCCTIVFSWSPAECAKRWLGWFPTSSLRRSVCRCPGRWERQWGQFCWIFFSDQRCYQWFSPML